LVRLRIAVALTVTIVWATAVVMAFAVNPDLITLVTVVTPVMLAVVGWLYADEVLRRRRTPAEDKHD
jgi:hypothetical protein